MFAFSTSQRSDGEVDESGNSDPVPQGPRSNPRPRSLYSRRKNGGSKSYISSLVGVACLLSIFPSVGAATLDLSALSSTTPTNASQPLSSHLISFSIETSFVQDFLGNQTTPNTLVLKLIDNIEQRSGAVGFRPGGITADSAIFSSSVTTSPVLDESASGGILRTTFGPSFFSSINLLPNTTLVVMDLNFGNDSYEVALEEARAAIAGLGTRLEALELGNEPDQFNSAQRDLSTWGVQEYTSEFKSWSTNLTTDLSLAKPFFQAGAFSKDPTSTALLTTSLVVDAGIATGGLIKTFSQHMYQYSTCDTQRNALATLDALVNHENITAYVDLWKPQVASAQSVGAELVIGEFNSISCSGKQNLSNTFGQGLWLADTILYSSSIGISRMYSHQGATLVAQSSDQANSQGYSWYDFVYPLASDRNGPATATPSYPAYLLLAEAISPPSSSSSSNASTLQIVYLPQTTSFPDLAVYALYTSSSSLARLVFLNLGAQVVDVSLPSSSQGKKIKRLSSKTGDVGSVTPEDATWNGQSYAQGDALGAEKSEVVAGNGTVTVGAWEGVVVFLDGGGTGDATATKSGSSGASATRSSGVPSSTGTAASGTAGSSAGERAISRGWIGMGWAVVGAAMGLKVALDFW